MKKFTAPYIFSGDGQIFQNSVVVTSDIGEILSIDPYADHDPASIAHVPDVITPGHINTHCHLELSHMKGKVATGTSLLPFLVNVVSFRDIKAEDIKDAIRVGDEEMRKNGIVAVGDISNKADTTEVKETSPIRYYTFVEMFDFLQDHLADSTFAQYKAVYDQQSDSGGNRKSMVPHAPYTVSKQLFAKLNEANLSGVTISVHNQETPLENQLFMDGTGGFVDFYKGFGFNMEAFVPLGKSAIHYIIEELLPDFKTIMVHNTTTTAEDIKAAHLWNKNIFWASCPNANLYIENSLPNYKNFLDQNAKVTLGTDSLTSNWQLSIAEEMKTISKFCSYVSFETLVTWACKNCAEALGFDDELGTIAIGKKPGLVAMDVEKIGERFVMKSAEVRRLI